MAGFDSRTVSLLHFDDAGSQFDMIDNKWTLSGSIGLSSSKSMLGGGALLIDAGSLSSSTVFSFGTGDFTVEMFVCGGNVGLMGAYATLITSRAMVSSLFARDNNQYPAFSLGSTRAIIGKKTVIDGAWHHIALTRSAGVFYLFIDGVLDGTSDAFKTNEVNFSQIGFAEYSPSNTNFNGYLDEVRVSNVARWTSSFTPTTEPYAVDANTLSLLHLNVATVKDERGLTWTQIGLPQVSNAFSRFGGASLYLDGKSTVDTAFSNVGPLGSLDFTFDFWIYPLSFGGGQSYIVSLNSDGVYENLFICIVGGQLMAYVSTTGNSWVTVTSGAVQPNAWSHVAVVRTGSRLMAAVNGVFTASAVLTGSVYNASSPTIKLGGYRTTANSWTIGYVDEFRISKGIARWTSNFTPPTQPYSFCGTLLGGSTGLYGANSDGTLKTLGVPTTNQAAIDLFKANSLPTIDGNLANLAAASGLHLVMWDADVGFKYSASAAATPQAQFVHEVVDVDLKDASYVDWVKVNDGITEATGSGVVRHVVSRDSGVTWWAFSRSTSTWTQVIDTTSAGDGTYAADGKHFVPSVTTLNRIITDGMDSSTVTVAPFQAWTLDLGFKKLRFGHVLQLSSTTDTALLDSIKYQYDGVGNWELAGVQVNYRIQTRNNSHTITWLSSIGGKRVKVNY